MFISERSSFVETVHSHRYLQLFLAFKHHSDQMTIYNNHNYCYHCYHLVLALNSSKRSSRTERKSPNVAKSLLIEKNNCTYIRNSQGACWRGGWGWSLLLSQPLAHTISCPKAGGWCGPVLAVMSLIFKNTTKMPFSRCGYSSPCMIPHPFILPSDDPESCCFYSSHSGNSTNTGKMSYNLHERLKLVIIM